MGAVTHPRSGPRRGAGAGTWWAKAWQRSVEEAAYGDADLRAGRAHARAGGVGAITIDAGEVVATVVKGDIAHTATITIPELSTVDQELLIEVLAAESGRLPALIAGDLPHALVEAVEEAGVEVLPYAGELGAECTCDAWIDPCPHALGVLSQVGWLVERDPFVLLHLRGLPRDEVLARVHALGPGARSERGHGGGTDAGDEGAESDLVVAEEAAWRAARELRVWARPE